MSKPSQLHLVFDHETFKLQITGNVANLDCALSMLAQATREMKARFADARRSNVSPADVQDILALSRGKQA